MTTPHDAELERLAAGEIDDEDLRILGRIGRLFDALDPVPSGLVERVSFGITLDALHAEIAELQRSGDLVGARSDASTEAQTVTFSTASLSLMVTISPTSAEIARIDGWLVPAAPAEVELRTGAGSLRRTVEEDGRFVFEDAPRGLGQFVVRSTDDDSRAPVVTPSIEF
jgi:hypothetical protein